MKFKRTFAYLITAATCLTSETMACTRAVYQGLDNQIITGRSMDFKDPMISNFWIFPRGMQRDGVAGKNSMKWTSKYGSLAVSGYDISTVDGMNEVGLNASLLWLNASTFPKNNKQEPSISLSIWAQYYLDQFATVQDAIEHTKKNHFVVKSGEIPGRPGSLAPLHLTLSDATGDSAVLEWIDGKLNIYHDRRYQVVTNDPPYNYQLVNKEYWSKINALQFIPGTARSEDRFIRAGFYINTVKQSDDPRISTAAVLSVIRNASAPYGISQLGEPHLSTTRWRIAADQKNKVFYAESAISPNIFWVDLNKIDFSQNFNVRKLELGIDMNRVMSGEVSEQFVPEKPFQFEPAAN